MFEWLFTSASGEDQRRYCDQAQMPALQASTYVDQFIGNVAAIPPGQFSTIKDGQNREHVIMARDDFEHVVKLAGLKIDGFSLKR